MGHHVCLRCGLDEPLLAFATYDELRDHMRSMHSKEPEHLGQIRVGLRTTLGVVESDWEILYKMLDGGTTQGP